MLTTRQVQQAVEFYLKRHFTQYAIMIDGGWGVGKTHLLNQHILPGVENIGYFNISLYGLSTIADIENEIYKSVSIADGNASPQTNGMQDPELLSGAKLGGVSYAVEYLVKQYQTQNAGNKLVFCFDDLERWNGKLDVCLSYINKLVEQDGIKCIVLGNSLELDERGIQELSRAREKVIRHIYRFENQTRDVVEISMGLIDYQTDSSRQFIQGLFNKNIDSLVDFMIKLGDKNIRTLTEAIQLFEYIYCHNNKQFERTERLAFTYFITLLSTLVLLKKHFVHKEERAALLEGNYEGKSSFQLLKALGFFDEESPEYINDESRLLLDTIFYRLDEISLRGVFSIIENGFYIEQDFIDNFINWSDENSYEKYLDKFYFYQLEEVEALKILKSIVSQIFEERLITNPATILLLAERILMDIQRDVLELDYEETTRRFLDLISRLYQDDIMDVMELEFLKVRSDRYATCAGIFEHTLKLNDNYMKAYELKNHQGFWSRLLDNADHLEDLIDEYMDKTVFCPSEAPDIAIETLDSLNNSQLYRFARKMQERRDYQKQKKINQDEASRSAVLAEKIFATYKHQFGIKSSNMKDIANVFY